MLIAADSRAGRNSAHPVKGKLNNQSDANEKHGDGCIPDRDRERVDRVL